MVFGARSAAIDRAPSGCGPPLSALTWELSITVIERRFTLTLPMNQILHGPLPTA